MANDEAAHEYKLILDISGALLDVARGPGSTDAEESFAWKFVRWMQHQHNESVPLAAMRPVAAVFAKAVGVDDETVPALLDRLAARLPVELAAHVPRFVPAPPT